MGREQENQGKNTAEVGTVGDHTGRVLGKFEKAITLLDSCYEIVELYQPQSPAQKEWKEWWLRETKKIVGPDMGCIVAGKHPHDGKRGADIVGIYSFCHSETLGKVAMVKGGVSCVRLITGKEFQDAGRYNSHCVYPCYNSPGVAVWCYGGCRSWLITSKEV